MNKFKCFSKFQSKFKLHKTNVKDLPHREERRHYLMNKCPFKGNKMYGFKA